MCRSRARRTRARESSERFRQTHAYRRVASASARERPSRASTAGARARRLVLRYGPTVARTVAVLGGSVAGLSTALLLARDGHRVTLMERDTVVVGDAPDSPAWDRHG